MLDINMKNILPCYISKTEGVFGKTMVWCDVQYFTACWVSIIKKNLKEKRSRG